MTQKEIQGWITYWQNAKMVAIEQINALDQVHLARKYCSCMRVGVFAEVSDLAIWRALENMRSGKYPEPIKPIASNCANWADGRCLLCGVQWQEHEVHGEFQCPNFRARDTGNG